MMKEGKSIEFAKPTRRKHTQRTENAAKMINNLLKEDPTKSMDIFAKEHFLGPVTVSKIVKEARGKVQGHRKKASVVEKDPGYRTGAWKK